MTRPEAPDSGPWAPVAASHVNLSVAALPPASAPPALPSSPSARYTARRLLGQGGMGRVFAVHDTVLGRDVALKEVQPRADLHALEQRLHAEARLTAAIAHPAVLPILDVGLGDDGRLHYTMPLVRGRSLGEAIAAPDDARRAGPGPLPTAALRRLLTACEAVAAAHRRGILHRDLKPENILVGSAGETWVADWGLAIQASDAASAGPPAEPVGTPGYIAPEIVGGAPPTPASDVWALGVILAKVATGQRQLGLLPPGALPPIEPPALAAIVHKALAPRPRRALPVGRGARGRPGRPPRWPSRRRLRVQPPGAARPLHHRVAGPPPRRPRGPHPRRRRPRPLLFPPRRRERPRPRRRGRHPRRPRRRPRRANAPRGDGAPPD